MHALRPALVLAGACSMASAAPTLQIVTEHSPPASMLAADGMVIGSGTEKVREIMKRAGIDYTIELLPWKRAYTQALEHPSTCIYSTTRTPERENLFQWIGPTDEGEWVLLGRADRQYGIKTLEDARRLRIGTYNGDARHEYLRARGFLVDPAPIDGVNPQKLMMNRIDLWAVSVRKGVPRLENSKWAGRIVPVLVFNQIKVYLACNPAVPADVVARLNAALDAANKDGTSRRIAAKYENWLVPKKQ
jgi:polar amino acid transport system substrate-binding protein